MTEYTQHKSNTQTAYTSSLNPLHQRTSHTQWVFIYTLVALVSLSLILVITYLGTSDLTSEGVANGVNFIPLAFATVMSFLASVHAIAANRLEQSSPKRWFATLTVIPLFLALVIFAIPAYMSQFPV